MFDTSHQGRADLVLAVPRGFGPINLPTTWLATDRRDHLPLLMEARQHHGSCRKIDVVAKHVTNAVVPFSILWGGGGGGGGSSSICNHYLSSCMDS